MIERSSLSAALDQAALQSWRDHSPADEESGDDRFVVASMAVRDWLAWIFEAGPHPHHLAVRLVACTSELSPGCLVGMSRREAQALTSGGAPLMRDVLRTSVVAVTRALTSAYHKNGRTWDPLSQPSTIEHMLAAEQKLADHPDGLVRAQAMQTWLRRIWDAGPRLAEALKALFVEARALDADLTLNMSGEEISAMFGQGRAAESARVRRRVNDFLARAGYRNTTLRFQKSATACRVYAKRQRGNHNRARGAAKAKAKAA